MVGRNKSGHDAIEIESIKKPGIAPGLFFVTRQNSFHRFAARRVRARFRRFPFRAEAAAAALPERMAGFPMLRASLGNRCCLHRRQIWLDWRRPRRPTGNEGGQAGIPGLSRVALWAAVAEIIAVALEAVAVLAVAAITPRLAAFRALEIGALRALAPFVTALLPPFAIILPLAPVLPVKGRALARHERLAIGLRQFRRVGMALKTALLMLLRRAQGRIELAIGEIVIAIIVRFIRLRRFAGPAEALLAGRFLLRGGDDTEIMLGMLEIGLRQHRVARNLRIARQLCLFFNNMLGRSAHLDIRSVGLVGAREGVGLLAMTPAHPVVVVLVVWPHRTSLWR